MIVKTRRPIKSRVRTSRVRPNGIDFPQIRKEVSLYNQIGVILKNADAFKKFSDSTIGNS